MNIERDYNTIANDFDKTRTKIWNQVKNFIANEINPFNQQRLLDVGIGNGKNSIFAKSYLYECIGIDISDNLISICRNKGLEVHKQNVLSLSNTDFGLFDKIICIAVIHHFENIEDQKKAIVNMINCLNTKGSLLISVWSKEYDDTTKSRLFQQGPNYVEWNSNIYNKVDRFYYIHDYHSFHTMIEDIKRIYPHISFEISWEKQNWFVEIRKL